MCNQELRFSAFLNASPMPGVNPNPNVVAKAPVLKITGVKLNTNHELQQNVNISPTKNVLFGELFRFSLLHLFELDHLIC